jgi:hypothetical protein
LNKLTPLLYSHFPFPLSKSVGGLHYAVFICIYAVYFHSPNLPVFFLFPYNLFLNHAFIIPKSEGVSVVFDSHSNYLFGFGLQESLTLWSIDFWKLFMWFLEDWGCSWPSPERLPLGHLTSKEGHLRPMSRLVRYSLL